MVLHLAERLDIPLRERNIIMVAAGFAPCFLSGGWTTRHARGAATIELVLRGHEPHPALALDRHWTMLAANHAIAPLLTGAAPPLLEPPVNVLRLSLHPEGLAPRIANLHEWRAHLLERLRRQVELTADAKLTALLEELRTYPAPSACRPPSPAGHGAVAVQFRLVTDHGVLSFLSTTTMFGTPVEITLSELVVESFFPADAETAQMLQGRARPRR